MTQGSPSWESSLHRCSWTQLCCVSRGIWAGTSFITHIGPCTKQPNIKIHHKSLKTNCNLSHQVFVTSAYCPHLGANLGVGGRVSFPHLIHLHLIHLHLIHLKLIHLLHLTFDFGVFETPKCATSTSSYHQVSGDCIRCPFHDWKFDGSTGTCVEVVLTRVKQIVMQIMRIVVKDDDPGSIRQDFKDPGKGAS